MEIPLFRTGRGNRAKVRRERWRRLKGRRNKSKIEMRKRRRKI